MKKLISAVLVFQLFIFSCPVFSQSFDPPKKLQLRVPDNTPIEVETASEMTSEILVTGSMVSFTVIKPVVVENKTAIEKGALVTAKVVKLKRGGYWGKAGKIGWEMIDVIAADGKPIPVKAQNEVTGVAKEGEAKTKAATTAVLLGLGSMGILAPLGLLFGFKKGKNVSVPAGTRFRVYTSGNSVVEVTEK